MDSDNQAHAAETAQADLDRIDFDDYASYEEGDSLVICDRADPNAWVKSDVTAELEN